ncbi:MAG: hypothetical protein H7A55_04950 [Verrucomicrobiaceae bacterium]|nr:hypothetical protein [Verrucomicrobiaceae bacterium]
MLNVQRTRHSQEQEEVQLPRIVMMTYLAAGWTVPVLYFLLKRHEAGGLTAFAFISSAAGIAGLCTGRQWCRFAIGIVWLAVAIHGVFFVLHILPTLPTTETSLVPPGFSKFWLGLTNLGGFVGGLMVLFSPEDSAGRPARF